MAGKCVVVDFKVSRGPVRFVDMNGPPSVRIIDHISPHNDVRSRFDIDPVIVLRTDGTTPIFTVP